MSLDVKIGYPLGPDLSIADTVSKHSCSQVKCTYYISNMPGKDYSSSSGGYFLNAVVMRRYILYHSRILW